MKELLGSSPVLRYPDYSKPFELYPDASRYQLGALLAQRETPTSEPHAIAYWSRMMIPAERNYTTSEQECLAIVEPLKRWQMYLLNYPFTVHVKTDHHPLTSLMTAHHESARLTRWALTMQEYQPQLTIKHIAGREQPGDPLSRLEAPGMGVEEPLDLETPLMEALLPKQEQQVEDVCITIHRLPQPIAAETIVEVDERTTLMAAHGRGWTEESHWQGSFCGQSCPCCRTLQQDLRGAHVKYALHTAQWTVEW